MSEVADKPSMDELKKFLEENGFTISGNRLFNSPHNICTWYSWRRSKLSARNCECNEDKKGVQIVVIPYESAHYEVNHQSVEIEVCGEANGVWYRLQAYSLRTDEVRDKLNEIEGALVNAWNALIPLKNSSKERP